MSTKTNHTPGPWYVAQTGRIYSMQHGFEIADILTEDRDKWTDEASANAALIAAAPELLEEEEANLQWIENLLGDIAAGRPLNSARIADGLTIRRDKTRAAIAKAKGETL